MAALTPELGTRLSTSQRLRVGLRETLLLASAAGCCWLLGVAALGGLLLVVLLFRLIPLLDEPEHCPHIIVTRTDVQRLHGLLAMLPPTRRREVAGLEQELKRAQAVDSREVPGDVVTMNSRVRFEEVHSGACMEARLVYPGQAGEGAVSVFAPEGSALLGLALGQAIDWRMPNGHLRRFRVVEVLYQPEAAGDLHL